MIFYSKSVKIGLIMLQLRYFRLILALVDVFVIQNDYNILFPILLMLCDSIILYYELIIEKKGKSLNPLNSLLPFSISLYQCCQSKGVGYWSLLGLLRVKDIGHFITFTSKNIVQELLRTLSLLSLFVLTMSCLWFYISCRKFDGSCEGWTRHDAVLDISSVPSILTRSTYFVLVTLFTIGYGDIHPYTASETLFTLVLMIFGSLWSSLMISFILSLLTSANYAYLGHIKELRLIKRVLQSMRVSIDFQHKLVEFMKFLYRAQLGVLEKDIFGYDNAGILNLFKIQCIGDYSLINGLSSHGADKVEREESWLSHCVPVTLPADCQLTHIGQRLNSFYILKAGKLRINTMKDCNLGLNLVMGDSIGDYECLLRKECVYDSTCLEETTMLAFAASVLKPLQGRMNSMVFNATKLIQNSTSLSSSSHVLNQFQQAHETRVKRLTVLEKHQHAKVTMRFSQENSMTDNKVEAMRRRRIAYGALLADILSMVIVLVYSVQLYVRLFAAIQAAASSRSDSIRLLSQVSPAIVVDYLCDLFMIAHFVFRYREAIVATVSGSGASHRSDVSVWSRYGVFVPFLLLVLPLDFFSLSFRMLWCFRINKLCGLFLVRPLATEARAVLEQETFNRIAYGKELIDAVESFIWATIFVVVSSGAWFALTDSHSSWVSSVYWCFTTITTTGYGDIVPTTLYDTLLCIATVCLGPVLFALVVAYCVTVLESFTSSDETSLHKYPAIKAWVKDTFDDCSYALPMSVTWDETIRDRCTSLFAIYTRESMLFGHSLTEHLKLWIRSKICWELIKRSKLFRKASDQFIWDILASLEQQLFIKDDVITHDTDIFTKGMYFIRSGDVRIEMDCGNIILKKYAGDCFGESEVFDDSKAMLQAWAITDCEVWKLSKPALQSIIRRNPFYRDELELQFGQTFLGRPAKEKLRRRNQSIKEDSDIAQLRARRQSIFFLSTNSSFVIYWQVAVVAAVVYAAIIVPYRIGFSCGSYDAKYFVLDYFCDSILIINVLIKFLSKERGASGFYQSLCKYLLTWEFAIGFISIFPVDIALLGFVKGWGNHNSSWLRVNRLLQLIELSEIVHKTERRHLRVVSEWRYFICFIKGVILILFSAHCCACMFFALVRSEYRVNQVLWLSAYAAGDVGMCTKSGFLSGRYVLSLYWAMQFLTSVGYGDVPPVTEQERSLNIVLYAVGTLLFASILNSVQQLLLQDSYIIDRHRKAMDTCASYLKRDLQLTATATATAKSFIDRSEIYFNQLWMKTKGIGYSEMKSIMGERVFAEMLYAKLAPSFSSTFLFKECNTDFLVGLIDKMVLGMYVKDDWLFCAGEAALSLHAVLTGDVVLTGNMPVSHNSSGDSGSNGDGGLGKSNTGASNDRRSVYKAITEGFVCESEFFTQSFYSCSARITNVTTTILHLSYLDFSRLLETYNLNYLYKSLVRKRHGELEKSGTAYLVKNVHGNFVKSKMTRLISCNLKLVGRKNLFSIDSRWGQSILIGEIASIWLEFLSIPTSLAFYESEALFNFSVAFDGVFCIFQVFVLYIHLKVWSSAKNNNSQERQKAAAGISGISIGQFSSQWFVVLSVLACIPWQLLTLCFTVNQSDVRNERKVYSIVRTLQILNICKVPFYSKLIQTSVTKKKSLLESTAKPVILLILLAHVFGSLLCAIGNLQEEESRGYLHASWLTANAMTTPLQAYLTSVYWAMYTLTTVGYGNVYMVTEAEKAYAIAVMILGTLFCSYLAGSVGPIIETFINKNNDSKRLEASLRLYMKRVIHQHGHGSHTTLSQSSYNHNNSRSHNNNVLDSSELSRQSQDYFGYVRDVLNGSTDLESSSILPVSLRFEMHLQWCHGLHSLPIAFGDLKFTCKSDKFGFVASLARKAHPYLAIPGEVILEKDICKGYTLVDNEALLLFKRGRAVLSLKEYPHRRSSSRSRKYSISSGEVINFSLPKLDIRRRRSMRLKSILFRKVFLPPTQLGSFTLKLVSAHFGHWEASGALKNEEEGVVWSDFIFFPRDANQLNCGLRSFPFYIQIDFACSPVQIVYEWGRVTLHNSFPDTEEENDEDDEEEETIDSTSSSSSSRRKSGKHSAKERCSSSNNRSHNHSPIAPVIVTSIVSPSCDPLQPQSESDISIKIATKPTKSAKLLGGDKTIGHCKSNKVFVVDRDIDTDMQAGIEKYTAGGDSDSGVDDDVSEPLYDLNNIQSQRKNNKKTPCSAPKVRYCECNIVKGGSIMGFVTFEYKDIDSEAVSDVVAGTIATAAAATTKEAKSEDELQSPSRYLYEPEFVVDEHVENQMYEVVAEGFVHLLRISAEDRAFLTDFYRNALIPLKDRSRIMGRTRNTELSDEL